MELMPDRYHKKAIILSFQESKLINLYLQMRTQKFSKRVREQVEDCFQSPDKVKKIKVDTELQERLHCISAIQKGYVNLEGKYIVDSFSMVEALSENQQYMNEIKEQEGQGDSNHKQEKYAEKVIKRQSDPHLESQSIRLQQQNKAVKLITKVKTLASQKQRERQPKDNLRSEVSENRNIYVSKGIQYVPVDNYFPLKDKAKVLQINKTFYSVTLTQSDLSKDENKFFIIQILEVQEGSNRVFYLFSRWGRVGVPGQVRYSQTPLDLKQAIRQYNSKSQEKVKRAGYKMIEVNYQKETIEDDEIGSYFGLSQLPWKVQELVKLIFDRKMMHSHMKEIGYDQKRSPLGLIAKKSIQKGYIALNNIMNVLKGEVQTVSQSHKRKLLNQHSGQFYSAIPHDFGYVNMQAFALNTQQKVKHKLEMLSSLSQIQIYSQLMKQKSNQSLACDIDIKYFKLKCNIDSINTASEAYTTIKKYLQNTHASTHNKYCIELRNIFRVERPEQMSRYRKQLGNKMLLWHGSRLSNYVGILSQGLKIAPFEAPATGYMFGKGIYFADIVSKSSNYCRPKGDSQGLMLLCEVALGQPNQKYKADYNAHNLPPGYHSTKGVGKYAPCCGDHQGDVFIPTGELKTTGIQQTSLLYNEYVIYNRDQVVCKYIIEVRFHFK